MRINLREKVAFIVSFAVIVSLIVGIFMCSSRSAYFYVVDIDVDQHQRLMNVDNSNSSIKSVGIEDITELQGHSIAEVRVRCLLRNNGAVTEAMDNICIEYYETLGDAKMAIIVKTTNQLMEQEKTE